MTLQPQPRTRTALVIGGGIAGATAALALRRAGIEATVYEAYDSTADGIGGGLTLAPNGLNALDAIGTADLVRDIGSPMTAIVLHSWNGKQLAEFGTPPGVAPMQFVWRTELYRALYAEAVANGVGIVHGKRLVRAEQDGEGVTAHFADGSSAGADLLVGADGIHSTVRSIIDPAAPQPRYAGLVSFGAQVRDSGLASTEGRTLMSFGKRAFFGWWTTEPEGTGRDGARRDGSDRDGTAVWFANLPRTEPMTAAEAHAVGAEEWLRVLTTAFADDRSPALDLLRRTDPADLLITGPMESMPEVPVWHRGRMVLLGDSAHAASSSSGQGASLAIESAVQLARCLRDLPQHQALTAYEQLRRPRVERIIKAAARTNSNKTPGPVGRVVRDAVMPLAMKLVKPEKMAWQYEYRINWSEPVPAPSTAATGARTGSAAPASHSA
ncbi:FAD-dependent monooxygenase [Streptacidiphilus sp. N1-12]|uniref:FAD-dependent monooxygenase n=2 Tax=Streptacidiphilus alkalitolerans TaxID=3342712 RepID=A0ABV6W7I8_9ACTN